MLDTTSLFLKRHFKRFSSQTYLGKITTINKMQAPLSGCLEPLRTWFWRVCTSIASRGLCLFISWSCAYLQWWRIRATELLLLLGKISALFALPTSPSQEIMSDTDMHFAILPFCSFSPLCRSFSLNCDLTLDGELSLPPSSPATIFILDAIIKKKNSQSSSVTSL